MKSCSICKEVKETSAFYSNKNTRDRLSSACIPCSRVRSRAYITKHRYGLTIESYQAMLEAQDNSCAACGIEFDEVTRPNVDHDHKCCSGVKTCGKCVRGLLCSKCNSMAGAIEYNLPYLDDVLRYLTFHLLRQQGKVPADINFSKKKIDRIEEYLNSYKSEVK